MPINHKNTLYSLGWALVKAGAVPSLPVKLINSDMKEKTGVNESMNKGKQCFGRVNSIGGMWG